MEYNIEEASRTLGYCSKTIRRWIKKGKLEARLVPSEYGQTWRITKEALEPHLEKKEAQTVNETSPKLPSPALFELIERLESLSREVGFLRGQNESLKKESERGESFHLEEIRDNLMRENEGLREQIELLKQRNEELEETCHQWKKIVDEMESHYR